MVAPGVSPGSRNKQDLSPEGATDISIGQPSSVARFAGSIYITMYPRAYARGYCLPLLRSCLLVLIVEQRSRDRDERGCAWRFTFKAARDLDCLGGIFLRERAEHTRQIKIVDRAGAH